MNYYRLETEMYSPIPSIEQTANQHELLWVGVEVDPKTLVLPWPFEVEIGLDSDDKKEEFADYDSSARLMSDRLISTIRSCGADNLQVFPAAIKNVATGEFIKGFSVVNIIGTVPNNTMIMAEAINDESIPAEAVDSKIVKTLGITSDGEKEYFPVNVVDPKLTKGLQIFRYEHSSGQIIVAEPVAEAIRKGGFRFVTLIRETQVGDPGLSPSKEVI